MSITRARSLHFYHHPFLLIPNALLPSVSRLLAKVERHILVFDHVSVFHVSIHSQTIPN